MWRDMSSVDTENDTAPMRQMRIGWFRQVDDAPCRRLAADREGPFAVPGANFERVENVRFGSHNATSFKVKSNGLILAVAPHGTRSAHVSMVTPGGTSNFRRPTSIGISNSKPGEVPASDELSQRSKCCAL
jgi:hypothetical protein